MQAACYRPAGNVDGTINLSSPPSMTLLLQSAEARRNKPGSISGGGALLLCFFFTFFGCFIGGWASWWQTLWRATQRKHPHTAPWRNTCSHAGNVQSYVLVAAKMPRQWWASGRLVLRVKWAPCPLTVHRSDPLSAEAEAAPPVFCISSKPKFPVRRQKKLSQKLVRPENSHCGPYSQSVNPLFASFHATRLRT